MAGHHHRASSGLKQKNKSHKTTKSNRAQKRASGAGRVERATGSGYLQAGETITASIEGIGTLTHKVVAEESVPDDLSGAQLPPTSSYRD